MTFEIPLSPLAVFPTIVGCFLVMCYARVFFWKLPIPDVDQDKRDDFNCLSGFDRMCSWVTLGSGIIITSVGIIGCGATAIVYLISSLVNNSWTPWW